MFLENSQKHYISSLTLLHIMDRLLREYTHVAKTDHWCDRCCNYIRPGDKYEGQVYASNDSGIITLKFHINPCCDYPDEPDYKENDLEREVKEEMKEAA